MLCHPNRFRHVAETPAGFVERAQHFGMLIVVCVVVWAVTGAGSFWPIWVIAFGGLGLAKRAYRTFGHPAVDA